MQKKKSKPSVTKDVHIVEIDDKHVAFRELVCADPEKWLWRAAIMPECQRDGSTRTCRLYVQYEDPKRRVGWVKLGAIQLAAVVDFAMKRKGAIPPPHSRGFPVLVHRLPMAYVLELKQARDLRYEEWGGRYQF